jgi:hypothetical protein
VLQYLHASNDENEDVPSFKDDSGINPNYVETFFSSESDTKDLDDSQQCSGQRICA